MTTTTALQALTACQAACERVIEQEGAVHFGIDFTALLGSVRAALSAAQDAPAEPIDMVLYCPNCGMQHIDGPEVTLDKCIYSDPDWDNPPHRSHKCDGCGHIWRPADVPTNGVAEVKTKGKADSPIAARTSQPTPTPAQDAQRCIDARNKLNAALHGEGAVIDSLEDAVDAAVRRLSTTAQDAAATVPACPGTCCDCGRGCAVAPQAAPTAAQPLTTHPYEARRYCSGDGAWTDWQPCTSDQAAWWRQGHAGKFEIRDRVSAAAQAPALVPLTEHYKLDNDRQVFFYEQDFYVLSNFSAFNLEWKGRTFPTSEHAYHYEKFAYERVGESANDAFQRRNLAMSIKEAPSAHEAFKLAERWKGYRRADWDAVKVDIMREILRAKASQHEYVRRKLLETGDRELIEDSWRDDYWGWGPNRDGQNMLGKLWMEVRAELRGITAGTTPKEQQ